MARTFQNVPACSKYQRPCKTPSSFTLPAGPAVYKIFKTLPDIGAGEDNDNAVEKLTAYFELASNNIYQTYLLRQAKQGPSEPIYELHTRCCGHEQHGEFHDEELEIKMRIVCNGTSTRLRKQALRLEDYSLQDMTIDGRKTETSKVQVRRQLMEKSYSHRSKG